jgi:hypothetical protein
VLIFVSALALRRTCQLAQSIASLFPWIWP